MLLDSRNASIPGNENNDHHGNEVPDKVPCPMDSDLGSYTSSFDPTTTLLVSKLPAIIFSQTHDLEPLFYPYGPLKKLQMVGAPLNGTLSVLVQYLSVSAAQEAKEALHGQNYINYQIEAQFLRPVTSPLDLVQASCVISPPGAGNKLETPSPVAVDATRTYRQPESYGSTRIPGNLTDPSKRPLRATPNFTLAFHDRNSSEIAPVSAQYVRVVACGGILIPNGLELDGALIRALINTRGTSVLLSTISSPAINIEIFLLETARPARYLCFPTVLSCSRTCALPPPSGHHRSAPRFRLVSYCIFIVRCINK